MHTKKSSLGGSQKFFLFLPLLFFCLEIIMGLSLSPSFFHWRGEREEEEGGVTGEEGVSGHHLRRRLRLSYCCCCSRMSGVFNLFL